MIHFSGRDFDDPHEIVAKKEQHKAAANNRVLKLTVRRRPRQIRPGWESPLGRQVLE